MRSLPPPCLRASAGDVDRRAGFRAAYANGAIWAIGNGLASSSLLVYVATSLGAGGLMISLILATPRLVGLLRLTAPALIERVGDRRRFCLLAYSTSALVLLAMPAMVMSIDLSQAKAVVSLLSAMVLIWSLYHLLEYLGTVSLWSWLGDLAPRRIRGRFIGYRERWLTFGVAVGIVVAGLAEFWRRSLPAAEQQAAKLTVFVLLWTLGAITMLASVAPLAWMPNLPTRAVGQFGSPLAVWLMPLRDRRYWRLLAFGCWFSFFNGVTQAPQGIFPYRVLDLSLYVMLALPLGMRLGQSLASVSIGRWADLLGNRPVMIVAQLLVAVGPLFYLAAGRLGWWWIGGAWIAWIAYAGLNVTLPNLMLKLSPGEDSSSYVAAYFALTGIAYGLSTVLGGWLFDLCGRDSMAWPVGPWRLDRFELFFLVGWLTRSAGVFWLLWIIEPGAKRLPEILASVARPIAPTAGRK